VAKFLSEHKADHIKDSKILDIFHIFNIFTISNILKELGRAVSSTAQ